MRRQFVTTVTKLLRQDERYVLLLGDIGIHGFQGAFSEFPKRVYNVGILEQATVGMAAGLAMTGLIPIVHTIAPFLVERAYEQLKIDFGYQGLHGLFVSVGASYDYASLGCTHHCPADVSLIENIPNFHIAVPGNQVELDVALRSKVESPTYIRMSENSYTMSGVLRINPADAKIAIVAIGPCIDMVIKASEGLPVCHVYASIVTPFPFERLHEPLKSGIKHIIVVEPYYSSHLADKIRTLAPDVKVSNFSLPRRFSTGYGNRDQHYAKAEFTANNLRVEIEQCLK